MSIRREARIFLLHVDKQNKVVLIACVKHESGDWRAGNHRGENGRRQTH